MEINKLTIVKFRNDHGLSQDQLADILGVDIRTVQNYEGDKVIPKTKMKSIAKLFEDYEKRINSVKKLSEYEIFEIIEHIEDNEERFLLEKRFRRMIKRIGKRVYKEEDIIKEIEELRSKVNDLSNSSSVKNGL